MKIPMPENLRGIDILRKAGYGLVRDKNNPEQSFSRRLGGGIYPRFHAYINPGFINLHLDQKQASYEGQSKHSGEYEGEVVEEEAERIKEIIAAMNNSDEKSDQAENEVNNEKKKGFFSGLFG